MNIAVVDEPSAKLNDLETPEYAVLELVENTAFQMLI
jgi:hypothetical protein